MKAEKEYLATYPDRNGGDVSVWKFDSDGNSVSCEPLPLYLNHVKHSLSGFAWGKHGPGSEQLAFAILCHHLHDVERAMDLHLEFEASVVAQLDSARGWALTEDQIDSAIAEICSKRV